MKLLVVSATIHEIKPFTDLFGSSSATSAPLIRCRHPKHSVDVLITGAGIAPTAFLLGRYLTGQGYDLAINAGIAGGFGDEFVPGRIVNVVEDEFSELGAEDDHQFIPLFSMGFADPQEKPFRDGKLLAPELPDMPGIRMDLLRSLPRVKGVTSNTIHGETEHILRISALHHPETESMEGAAFLYSCLMADIPCIQIRSISNRVEKRDRSKWRVAEAISSLNDFIIQILH